MSYCHERIRRALEAKRRIGVRIEYSFCIRPHCRKGWTVEIAGGPTLHESNVHRILRRIETDVEPLGQPRRMTPIARKPSTKQEEKEPMSDFRKVAEHILDEILNVTYKSDPPFGATEAGTLRERHVTRIAACVAGAALAPDDPKVTAAVTLRDAIDRAAELLPDNWQIVLELEHGYGGASLIHPTGAKEDLNPDGANSIADQLLIGVDKANAQAPAEDRQPGWGERKR